MDNPPLVGRSGTAVGELPLKLSVLVVYEDLATGLRAKRALDQFVEQLEKDGELEVDFWRCDLLREPALREQASSKAARSNILFVSAHRPVELPMLRSWLQESLACQREEPRALALALDPSPQDTVRPTYMAQDLSALAQLAGVEVFVYAAEVPAASQDRGETLMEEALSRSEWHQLRDWGINE